MLEAFAQGFAPLENDPKSLLVALPEVTSTVPAHMSCHRPHRLAPPYQVTDGWRARSQVPEITLV